MENVNALANEQDLRTEIIRAYFDSIPKYTRTDRFRSVNIEKEKTVLDLILEVLIDELDIKSYKFSPRTKSIDFHIKVSNSYLYMKISYTDIDNIVSINAFYPYQYDEKQILQILTLLEDINSSGESLPLGKISLIKGIGLINIENKYIYKVDKPQSEFDKSEFLTYLSSTIVSANRLYNRFEKYLINETEEVEGE